MGIKSKFKKKCFVETSPSLALIKYWGKVDRELNLAATSSIGVTLDNFKTKTTVSFAENDIVKINGEIAPSERFQNFFQYLRVKLGTKSHFYAESTTNFPVDAGLASSSSGFAALALGCAKLIDSSVSMRSVSDIARLGSASAARSLYGGFTLLKKSCVSAEPISVDWPELRVIIGIVVSEKKIMPSRQAMEKARLSSPYYKQWL